jgi:6-pyruvoyltetrahydropterin/6-carboxytetrahydropterin synthase
MVRIRKTFRFEASHILSKHPGKCSRLHGHSWVLHVSVDGSINKETGFVMDFGDLKNIVQPIVDSLDHRHLGTWAAVDGLSECSPNFNYMWVVGELPGGFYPTSENLLMWVADQLQGCLNWSVLSLEETCTSEAILTREEWEEARFV